MLGPDEIADVEGDASALYRLAKRDSDEVVSVATLCRSLIGSAPQAIRMRQQGSLSRIQGDWRIHVRVGLTGERARWVAAHELAHWWYDHIGYSGADLEARCDALGAAIVVPRGVLRRAVRHCGLRYERLAKTLKTTQSLVLLRVGEAHGVPSVLLHSHGRLVRGEDYSWPEMSLKREPAPHPGLRTVKIHDEPRRLGVVAT